MILNSGMRTDIPAFYPEWFFNRLRAGFVLVRNPYNPRAVTKYRISPDVVDLLVFCTKNPAPMLSGLDRLSEYGQYWFVTITPYGKEIEPNVPGKEEVINSFRKLSDQVGLPSVCWRYDPVFISKKYTLDFHLEAFERMAEKLSGYTEHCVISFLDIYKKVQRNFPEARPVLRKERLILGKEFVRIGKKHGIVIKGCAEGTELSEFGVDCSGCMTVSVFERALGQRLLIPKQYSGAREECGCILGNDIGAYDSCPHLCRYCYANTDRFLVRENRKRHDSNSPFLIGGSEEGDVIHEAKQISFIDRQMRLEF